MIEIRDLVLRYPRAPRAAVEGVSIVAAAGAITAVVGPNGSGKSSIVRALLRRLDPVAGELRLDGVALHELEPRETARRMAVVPQREAPAFPALVGDVVALGRYPHGRGFAPLGDDDRRAIDAALDTAGVRELRDRSTEQLSGGEWQRVRIARALAQDAPNLVLDEPTTFLDVSHEMAVFELLEREARRGRTVLLVSHQLNLVARFADVMVLLDRGTIAASGPPDEVMRGPVLERVYEWPVVVTRDPAVGAPALVPLRGTIR